MNNLNITPSFGSAYIGAGNKWLDMTKEKKVRGVDVILDYEASVDRQAMYVTCDKVLVNYGFWIRSADDYEQVVLTGKEARLFEAAKNQDEQRGILNSLYGATYLFFGPVNVHKTDDLEFVEPTYN